jgi:hypothetical protein
MRTLYTFLILLSGLVAYADSSVKSLDRSEVWVMNGPPGLALKLDPVYHVIDVTLLKDLDQLPTSIGVTLFDSNGGSTLLELKALDVEGLNSYRGAYSGVLSPTAQSVIGFEIRIPFGSGSDTILRSEDMNKLNP